MRCRPGRRAAARRLAAGRARHPDDVPHSWLFPRTAAVVHHGGAATTAAALRGAVAARPAAEDGVAAACAVLEREVR